MELLDLIETKRKELTELNEKMNGLKSEISDLEAELDKESRKREFPRLKNYHACINQVNFISEDCSNCTLYERCDYINRGDYSILKNLHSTRTKREQSDVETSDEWNSEG